MVSSFTETEKLGDAKSEFEIKQGLERLNPLFHFDYGGRLDRGWHPRIDEWQGVYYNRKHIGGMDRGMIPEYSTWLENQYGERIKLIKIGWRLLFLNLEQARIPNVNQYTLTRMFNFDWKLFHGIKTGNLPGDEESQKPQSTEPIHLEVA